MSTKTNKDKPYMDKPEKKETTKEQMIYGSAPSLEEVEKKKEKYEKNQLNEDK